MKKTLLTLMTTLGVLTIWAQQDSTTVVDTIRTENYFILKNSKKPYDSTRRKTVVITTNSDDFLDIRIDNRSKKKNKNISTNWFIFDLGFANVKDETNYATAQSGSYFQTFNKPEVDANSMNLINNKSSNFNLWFFMQKVNLSKHHLNLKYGLGLEQFNFRYENNLSFRNKPTNYIFNDSINFSKNKLFVNYLTVPVMFNYNSNPESKSAFQASAGVSVGYLLNARNKQVSAERGKQKTQGNLDLETFKVSLVGELGLGPVRLYGSYSLNNMFKSSTGLDQTPFAFGVRFSRW